MKIIKIVTAVERIPVQYLGGMFRVNLTSVSVPAATEWQAIQIKPHAQLVITDKQEDKNTVWTAKLTFKTCETMAGRGHFAYRCRLKNGQYRLVGTDERPYPVLSVSETMPENVTDNQLNEVTVSWSSPQFIPYIVE
ncbi:MAG: hypothetical protein IKH86_04520 [Prevotella sp.]|nr:hypothetical protein [Prevotella sp.]